MLVLRILILILILRATSLEFSMSKTANNYGPYNSKWYNYKKCPVPRSNNVVISSSWLDIGQYGAVAVNNVTFTMPALLEMLKVTLWSIKGDQKNLLWNYKVNKPCQHFVIAGILKQIYQNMHNCVVPPGNYNFKTNYTEIAYQFIGNSFFYGTYSFKISAAAKQGNLICIQMNALFSKKV